MFLTPYFSIIMVVIDIISTVTNYETFNRFFENKYLGTFNVQQTLNVFNISTVKNYEMLSKTLNYI